MNRVLVACPTHRCKEYCFQQWIDNVKALTYTPYDILVVDNSPDDSYVRQYGDQVPMIHLDHDQDMQQMGPRICRSMAEIQRHFLAGPYTHWMNIEADVIPPVGVIETLLKYGQDADWISHCYPATPTTTMMQGIGCSLLSRRLMSEFDWDDMTIANDDPAIECWNWVQARPSAGYKTVELSYVMDVRHLK